MSVSHFSLVCLFIILFVHESANKHKFVALASTNGSASFSFAPVVSTPWPARAISMYTTDPSLNGVAWIFGGQNNANVFYNDVWKTVDGGLTWNNTFQNGAYYGPQVRAEGCLMYTGGRLLLLGGWPVSGFLADSWYSFDDGVTWHSNFSSGYYAGRWDGGCAATPSGIVYYAGGYSQGSVLNDVWRSLDYGQSFTQMTANAPWQPRYVFQNGLTAFNGQIFLIGGDTITATRLNDVWSSSDGITWIQRFANGSPGSFYPRYLFMTFVMSSQMYVVYGQGLNDIWSTSPASNGTVWTPVPSNISATYLQACGMVVTQNVAAADNVTVFCGISSVGNPSVNNQEFTGLISFTAPTVSTTTTTLTTSTATTTTTAPTTGYTSTTATTTSGANTTATTFTTSFSPGGSNTTTTTKPRTSSSLSPVFALGANYAAAVFAGLCLMMTRYFSV